MYYRLFSIVTVCYGRWHHLQSTISSWLKQDYQNFDIVVVYAGSDADRTSTLAQLSDYRGGLVRVNNAPYYRPGYMRNVGAMVARGEYLGFVDADVRLHPSWITECVNALRTPTDMALHEHQITGHDTGGASGTLAMERWMFEKIRGYNENLDEYWGYEDTDLVVRAQKAGGRPGQYRAQFVEHIQHGDDERGCHHKQRMEPRAPATFLSKIKIVEADNEVHPYEANRVRRVSFPPDDLEIIYR